MPRSNSIFGQKANELDVSDFIPLYYSEGDEIVRRTPDSLHYVLRRRLLDAGRITEAVLMSKLVDACEITVCANALFANAKVLRDGEDGDKIVEMLDAFGSVTGIPVTSVISWAIRHRFRTKMNQDSKKTNNNSGNRLDFMVHAIIFSYLFSVVVGKKIEHFYTSDERDQLLSALSKEDRPQLGDLAGTVKARLDLIIRDVVYVLNKDLAERTTEITYEDMLITAIMGTPSCRFDESGNHYLIRRRDHVSGRYEPKRSMLYQAVLINVVNPMLEKRELVPYGEEYSEAGKVTLPARRRLQTIMRDSEQQQLWKEVLGLIQIHSRALTRFSLSNNVGFMAKFLHDQAENDTLDTKDDKQREAQDLRTVIRQFNLQATKKQILEHVMTENRLEITGLSSIDGVLLDDILELFRDNPETTRKLEYVSFSGTFEFGTPTDAEMSDFQSELKKINPSLLAELILKTSAQKEEHDESTTSSSTPELESSLRTSKINQLLFMSNEDRMRIDEEAAQAQRDDRMNELKLIIEASHDEQKKESTNLASPTSIDVARREREKRMSELGNLVQQRKSFRPGE